MRGMHAWNATSRDRRFDDTPAYGLGSNTRLNQLFEPFRKMTTTAHFSTKDRILGAAEELFAQYGFAGTSLRQVTSRLKANV